MTLVKVDSEEKKIAQFATKEARKNQQVRFNEEEERSLVNGITSTVYIKKNNPTPTNARDQNHRSPLENLEAAMIMDSTS